MLEGWQCVEDSTSYHIILIAVGLILGVVVAIICVCVYRRLRRSKYEARYDWIKRVKEIQSNLKDWKGNSSANLHEELPGERLQIANMK